MCYHREKEKGREGEIERVRCERDIWKEKEKRNREAVWEIPREKEREKGDRHREIGKKRERK